MWTTIDGFTGYEVSDEGVVRNAKTGHVIAQFDNGRGYLKVGIKSSDDGKFHNVSVHRMFLLGEFFTGRKHVTDTELSDDELEKVLLELRDDTVIRCSACHVLVFDGTEVTYTHTDDGAWSVDAGMPLINFCPNCGARVEMIGE